MFLFISKILSAIQKKNNRIQLLGKFGHDIIFTVNPTFLKGLEGHMLQGVVFSHLIKNLYLSCVTVRKVNEC